MTVPIPKGQCVTQGLRICQAPKWRLPDQAPSPGQNGAESGWRLQKTLVVSPRAPEVRVDRVRHNASLETEGSYCGNHRNPVTEDGQTAIFGSVEDQGARAD